MIQSNAFESNASANANADESNANASANASAAKESSASANANAAFALALANASAFEHKPVVQDYNKRQNISDSAEHRAPIRYFTVCSLNISCVYRTELIFGE